MLRYFFDYTDGTRAYPDDEGTELPGLSRLVPKRYGPLVESPRTRCRTATEEISKSQSEKMKAPSLWFVSFTLSVEHK
jgi:hypothetical protein